MPGDFDGDRDTDIIWYTPGASPDFLWWAADGSFSSALAPAVNGSYVPVAADLDANGRDDVVWYAPGRATDNIWWSNLDAFPVPQRSPLAM